MAGFARPELLATTEWLAEKLGRPDLRVLDVRWRPDGSGRTLYGAGHIPGAVHLDWRADLIDTSEGGDALLLATPDRVAATVSRAGVGDGTTVVIYDDTRRPTSPPGSGGACGSTASSRRGSSTAAIPPGSTRAARSRTARSWRHRPVHAAGAGPRCG